MATMKRRQQGWMAVPLFAAIAMSGFGSNAAERVSLGEDSRSATFSEKLGDGHEYVLHARRGEVLTVSVDGPAGIYFNVLPPGGEDALANSAVTGDNRWSDTLRRDGDYTVRVYQARAATHRGRDPAFSITLALR
jgi:hypothetical protein